MHLRFKPLTLLSAAAAGGLLAAALIAMGPAAVFATGDAVSVHVNQSDGSTGLQGVTIHYKCGTSTLNFGTTDANGDAGPVDLPDAASCTLTAIYRNTAAAQTVTISDGLEVNFQTSAVTVTLTDHNGGPLAGGVASYKSGSTVYLNDGPSVTDGTGAVTGQLFDGTYDFRMVYNGGTEWQYAVAISGDTTVPFQTGLLSIVYSNSLSYGGPAGDSAFFTKTGTELLPGTYTFHPRGVGYPANSGCRPITIDAPAAGASATKTILAAQLEDSSGNPLSGGDASYYHLSFHAMGTTDATGAVCAVVDGALGNTAVAMSYNGTHQQISQNAATDSIYNFQTADVAVKLEDADGNPLDTGSASYYAVSWHTIGDTLGGQVHVQMLPGSYSFAMVYNHTRQQYDGVAVSLPTTDVVFQTGRLTAHFSEPFDWLNSQFYSFTQPTMEFLPGNINLDLEGCYVPLTITAGDHLVKYGVLAKLTDSTGHALAGGDASAYAGGWHTVGTTDSHGRACAAFDHASSAVAMVYNGTRQQINQNSTVNSIYNFSTSDVTVELRDSTNTLIDTGTASYYAAGWHTIGDTSGGQVAVQMLPGNYSFAMVYNGTREQFNGVSVSGTSTTVTFQTSDVTVELRDSSNALIDTGSASYYAAGWHTIGDTSGGQVDVQMLPGNYSFAMVYNGTREQFNGQAVSGTSTTITFQTSEVDSATATAYYAGGWKAFTSGMQLLPGTYTFAFSSGPNAAETITAGVVNTIP
jgi:hypothetical protein